MDKHLSQRTRALLKQAQHEAEKDAQELDLEILVQRWHDRGVKRKVEVPEGRLCRKLKEMMR